MTFFMVKMLVNSQAIKNTGWRVLSPLGILLIKQLNSMKVSELIEALSRYDRDDDVTFYYLKNNILTNCQFEDLGFYGDMGVEFTIQDTYDGKETTML